MGRHKTPIKDIELRNPNNLIMERIPLTPETLIALKELARKRISILEVAAETKIISKKRAIELALFWIRSGTANPKIVQKLNHYAPFQTIEQLHNSCLVEFLAVNNGYKIHIEGENSSGGRPKGYVPHSQRLRIAMGEIIAELINGSPEARRALKAA